MQIEQNIKRQLAWLSSPLSLPSFSLSTKQSKEVSPFTLSMSKSQDYALSLAFQTKSQIPSLGTNPVGAFNNKRRIFS